MQLPEQLPDNHDALLELHDQAEREWWWLNGALHGVAQLQADGPSCITKMRDRQRSLDRARVQISVRLAGMKRG